MSEPRQDDLRRAMSTLVRERTPHGVPPFPGVRRQAVRRRRVRTFAVTALAALVLVAGAAVAVRLRDAGPDRAPVAALPVDGPAPQRTTREGMQFELTGEAPLTKVWIDPRDRSSLVVEAGEGMADVTGVCGAFTVVRILAQDDGTVSLGAFRYQRVGRGVGNCPDRPGWVARHVVHLGAPVGGRTVLGDGKPLVVHDPADAILPTTLPAGYRQPGLLLWGLPEAMPEPQRRGRSVGWMFESTGEDATWFWLTQVDPDARAALAAVRAGNGFDPEDTVTVESRPTVRGHAGVVFMQSPVIRCLRWEEAPTSTVALCHHRPAGPLPAADLLAIAEGLRGA